MPWYYAVKAYSQKNNDWFIIRLSVCVHICLCISLTLYALRLRFSPLLVSSTALRPLFFVDLLDVAIRSQWMVQMSFDERVGPHTGFFFMLVYSFACTYCHIVPYIDWCLRLESISYPAYPAYLLWITVFLTLVLLFFFSSAFFFVAQRSD
jgi:hypothetical protein